MFEVKKMISHAICALWYYTLVYLMEVDNKDINYFDNSKLSSTGNLIGIELACSRSC